MLYEAPGRGLYDSGLGYAINYLNPAAIQIVTQIMGLEVGLHRSLVDIAPPLHRKALKTQLEEAFEGSMKSFDFQVQPKGQEQHYWITAKAFPIRKDCAGKVIALALELVDVTAQKEMENRMERMKQQRKREVVGEIIRHQEMDRKEIAEALHENINQVLASAKLLLDAMPEEGQDVGRFKNKVKHILAGALNTINQMSNLINPDCLNHISLTEAVNDLVNRCHHEKGMKLELDTYCFDEGIPKNHDHELTLLRVVQECIYRILHHSPKRSVKIIMETLDHTMFVRIVSEDNTLCREQLMQELSIRNLINRCEHFGGSFTMENRRHRGFLFMASIPNNAWVDSGLN